MVLVALKLIFFFFICVKLKIKSRAKEGIQTHEQNCHIYLFFSWKMRKKERKKDWPRVPSHWDRIPEKKVWFQALQQRDKTLCCCGIVQKHYCTKDGRMVGFPSCCHQNTLFRSSSAVFFAWEKSSFKSKYEKENSKGYLFLLLLCSTEVIVNDISYYTFTLMSSISRHKGM